MARSETMEWRGLGDGNGEVGLKSSVDMSTAADEPMHGAFGSTSVGRRPWVLAGLFVGGVCGSVARLSLLALQPSGVVWPWMTTAINLTGAFLLGLLTGAMSRIGADAGAWKLVRLTVGTGVIGGFTTYSTFVLEGASRLMRGATALGVTYLLSCAALGLVLAWLGLVAGRSLGGMLDARRDRDFCNDIGLVDADGAGGRRLNAGETSGAATSGDCLRVLCVALSCVLLLVALAFGFGVGHWRRPEALALLIGAAMLGGVGAVLRYCVDGWVSQRSAAPIPLGTIVVNVTACLAIGLVSGWVVAHSGFGAMGYLIDSGLLGGYSTFSTASVEGARLARQGRPWAVLVHCGAMLALSLLGVTAGLILR